MSESLLKGRVAVISGALGDIGRAVALEIARLGADVAMSDLAAPVRAEDLLRAVKAMGRAATYSSVDVTDAGEVERWAESVQRELGLGTLVIPCAATVTVESVRELTAEKWRRELDVNLSGSFFVAQAWVRRMLAAERDGRVVFVGSWAASVPHAHVPAYSVSKAGVRMLCQCMALDLARTGILVNEVAPGYVDAGLSAAVFREKAGARESAERRVPTGRLITPEDVAGQVAYLCTYASRHMTGTVLLMDGGLSLGAAQTSTDGGAR